MSTIAACILLATSGSGLAGSLSARSLANPWDASNAVGALVAESGTLEDAKRLSAVFSAAPANFPLRGQLPLVKVAFLRPFALAEIARFAAAPALDAPAHPYRAVAAFAARAFGVAAPAGEGQGTMICNDPQRAIFALDFMLNEPTRIVREALDGAHVDRAAIKPVAALLHAARNSTSRSAGVNEALMGAMHATAALDRAALVRAVAHLDVKLDTAADWKGFPADDLPDELKGAVEGRILSAQPVPELGWIVVGSMDANRYDMSKIAAVFDPGGDDVYEWKEAVAGSRIVVDLAGNDLYRSAAGTGPGGPGGAVLGVSIIDDYAGNDRYEAAECALGAAAFGVGVIVDRAGDDIYRGGEWTLGAAMGGIGAVIDLGGSDEYTSQVFSQGCGGPGGVALLFDATGNDRYRADGSEPSAYDTPTVHMSFSQGCGFGYRIGAPGGIGALVDAAGDDRYECGEFGQGIGYYLSMGILHDLGGRDLYYANRYAQGTAAHQAFGALLDDAGDDIYWSMTAAGQGAAWDVSAAVLVDGGGDDRYQADGLSQGAAAQQAIGMLFDLDGADDYRATGASQGAADSNEYHWDATHGRSLGILVDQHGPNRWSGDRADGQRRRTGDVEQPNGRTQWGFFITR